jgi:hypothetical protein
VGLRRLSTTGSGEIGAFVGHVPGDALLHPVSLASIALLLINDHLLKAIWPGLITGKLSDFAGLVFFPLLLIAVWQMALALLGRDAAATTRQLVTATALTATLFAAIKLYPPANEMIGALQGTVQWLVGQLIGAATSPGPVTIALDPTDLVALPILAVAYRVGRSTAR